MKKKTGKIAPSSYRWGPIYAYFKHPYDLLIKGDVKKLSCDNAEIDFISFTVDKKRNLFCKPKVKGIIRFHLVDQTGRNVLDKKFDMCLVTKFGKTDIRVIMWFTDVKIVKEESEVKAGSSSVTHSLFYFTARDKSEWQPLKDTIIVPEKR